MDGKKKRQPAAPGAFSRSPIVVLAASFAAGIIVSPGPSAGGRVAAPLLALLFGALALAAGSRKRSVVFLAIAFIFAGAFGAGSSPPFPPNDSIGRFLEAGVIGQGDPVVLKGTVVRCCEPTPSGTIADLAVSSFVYKGRHNAAGTVRLFILVRDENAALDLADLDIGPGSVIEAASIVTREERFFNPGSRGFLDHLERSGIDATGLVKSPLLIETIRPGSRGPSARISSFREYLVEELLSRFQQPASGILVASMLGNRHFLSKDAGEVFRSGGTFHVLVVSGLHVTLVGGAALWMLGAAGVGSRARLVAACCAVWFFAALAGSGTPVIRASVMFGFLAAGGFFRRQVSALNSLSASALLLLVWDPGAIRDPSFQLTFAGVGALSCGAMPLISKLREAGAWHLSAASPLPPRLPGALKTFCELLYWDPRVWESRLREAVWECRIFKSPHAEKIGGSALQATAARAFEALLATMVINLCTLPLQVFYFHRAPFAGLVLNIPAAAALLLQGTAACLALAAAPFSETVSGAFAALTSVLVDLSIRVQHVAVIAVGSRRVPVYAAAALIVYPLFSSAAVLLLAHLYLWDPFGRRARTIVARRSALTLALVLLSLSAVIVLHPFSSPRADGRLHVTFLDVGQGDSVFVRFPDGKTMLIDGGGRLPFGDEEQAGFSPDIAGIGESVVSEFLWEQGYDRIDIVVATHSDADHIQGLAEVVTNFRVGRILYGIEEPENAEFLNLALAATGASVPMTPVTEGDRFESGGAEVLVLNPKAAGSPETGNDSSVVLRLRYGQRSFLLTGDIERKSESALIRKSPAPSDVVKVPHHGSRTSSSEGFVAMADAEFCVVSAGRRSRFGHPHTEVVDRWRRAGTRVLSTAESGAVTFITDGSLLAVSTFR